MYVIYTNKESDICSELYEYFILNKISFSCIFIDENSEVSKELKSNSGFLELPIVFKRNSSFHKNFIESGEVVGGCYGLLKSIEKGYHKVKNGERWTKI